MDRLSKANNHLLFWQNELGLQNWNIEIKYIDFENSINFPQFPQSGDIKVDLDKQEACILITKKESHRDSAIILHELIHLLLWDLDQYCGSVMVGDLSDQYFDKLEKTVADLATIFILKNPGAF